MKSDKELIDEAEKSIEELDIIINYYKLMDSKK